MSSRLAPLERCLVQPTRTGLGPKALALFSSVTMTIELESIVDAARTAFAGAATPADLENAKAQFIGKAINIAKQAI